jgi:hypothetical protein
LFIKHQNNLSSHANFSFFKLLNQIIDACTFKNQKSGEGGYALAILSSSALVNGSSFTNNSARESSLSRTSLGGGAIYVKGLSIYMVEENAKLQFVHIDNCTLNANMGKYGGGLFFYGPNSVTVSRSFFLSNYASMHGGGVYVTGSGQMKLVSSFGQGNRAEKHGGAIAIQQKSELYVGTYIKTSSGYSFHGSQRQHANKDTTIIVHNNAKLDGGGIYVDEGANLFLGEQYSLLLRENSAQGCGGGIAYFSDASFSSFHVTNFPTDNVASRNGSNVWAYGDAVKPLEIQCLVSTYFPGIEYKNGIPWRVWNMENTTDALCIKCSSGKTSAGGGTECFVCPRGKAGENGFCHMCAQNTYQPHIGTLKCLACNPGEYTDGLGQVICEKHPAPCTPINVRIALGAMENGVIESKVIDVFWSFSSNYGCGNERIGFEIEVSTHRTFAKNSIGDEYYLKKTNSKDKRIRMVLNGSFPLRIYFARVRAVNTTTQALSDFSQSSEPYESADDCAAYEYLNISKLNPHDEIYPWKCAKCMDGGSCEAKSATIIELLPKRALGFYMTSIKAKFGYWRSNITSTYKFLECPFPPACLGAPNEGLKGVYKDEFTGNDPALVDRPETCNEAAGYREACYAEDGILGSSGNSKMRCKLCTSCTIDQRRSYASPRCKLCGDNNVIFSTLVALAMIIAFVLFLRIGLSTSGRKRKSGHQRRLLLSYMQISTLLSTIGTTWPKIIKDMFDLQSAISTVGDHVLNIQCFLPNEKPMDLVYKLHLAYVIAPFVCAVILWGITPLCMYGTNTKKRGRDFKTVHTRANSAIKSIVLLVYMLYPSLVRQAFVMWHCVAIDGVCVNDDGSENLNMSEYMCETTNGYAWKPGSPVFGNYLFMATEQRCWSGAHWFYIIAVGIPHFFLYVIGLPLIGLFLVYRHKRKNNLRRPDILFCYGFLYDGYKGKRWWYQAIIAYGKALLVFVSYFYAQRVPLMAVLCAIFILTILLMFEVMFRPWTGETRVARVGQAIKKKRRASIAARVVTAVGNGIEDLKIAKFSSLSLFICLLTAWAGLYLELNPECNEKRTSVFNECNVLTISVIVCHAVFFLWSIKKIIKTKRMEAAMDRREALKISAAEALKSSAVQALKSSAVDLAHDSSSSNSSSEHSEDSTGVPSFKVSHLNWWHPHHEPAELHHVEQNAKNVTI